ncbi:MAG: hypothetical protein RLZZ192_886 [Pseudomonadota bacterium]|jgi:hypothetical protein
MRVGPTENGDVRVFGGQKFVESSRFGHDAKRDVGVALQNVHPQNTRA